jgi:hypothetical protein
METIFFFFFEGDGQWRKTVSRFWRAIIIIITVTEAQADLRFRGCLQ